MRVYQRWVLYSRTLTLTLTLTLMTHDPNPIQHYKQWTQRSIKVFRPPLHSPIFSSCLLTCHSSICLKATEVKLQLYVSKSGIRNQFWMSIIFAFHSSHRWKRSCVCISYHIFIIVMLFGMYVKLQNVWILVMIWNTVTTIPRNFNLRVSDSEVIRTKTWWRR